MSRHKRSSDILILGSGTPPFGSIRGVNCQCCGSQVPVKGIVPPISVRTKNALSWLGIVYLWECADRGGDDLARLHGIGPGALQEIRLALLAFGVPLTPAGRHDEGYWEVLQ